MHLYENITIFNPTLTDEDIKATVDKTTALITENGGEILKEDHWGRRRMAYMLNKHEKGYYVLILFKDAGTVMSKIEQSYKVNEQIIKHMTIKLGKKHAAGALNAVAAEKAAAEAPKPVEEAPKAAAEAPKPVEEAPKAAAEAPKVEAEAPKVEAEAPAAKAPAETKEG